MAESGDLLLFKSKSFLSRTWRTLLNHPYDHVALLIPYRGSIFVIEAVAGLGVVYNQLDERRLEEWRHDYSMVVYRKLICTRSADFESAILESLRRWAGRPYELSMEKLRRSHSMNLDYKDFFCSQLVAAFYKKLSLLPRGVSSCVYWPSSFASNHKLVLPVGVLLSEEMEVSIKLKLQSP
jgi:hypothetical protein